MTSVEERNITSIYDEFGEVHGFRGHLRTWMLPDSRFTEHTKEDAGEAPEHEIGGTYARLPATKVTEHRSLIPSIPQDVVEPIRGIALICEVPRHLLALALNVDDTQSVASNLEADFLNQRLINPAVVEQVVVLGVDSQLPSHTRTVAL